MSYIDKITKQDLIEYILICKLLNIEFDEEKFQAIVSATLKYLNGDKSKRDELRIMQELENSWYQSLEENRPDFSVYDNVYYLADVWVCWKKYSRQYIKSIISDKSLAAKTSIKDNIGAINTIVDLGCGIGYTTAAFKEIFNCTVYGTNIKNTHQYKICQQISDQTGFILTDTISYIKEGADLVFASEYFEHFERPVEHLIEVLIKLKPKHFLFANTFNAKSIGHFNIYKHEDKNYTGKEITKLFSRVLKDFKYKKIDTNCWNNRPNYYIHEN